MVLETALLQRVIQVPTFRSDGHCGGGEPRNLDDFGVARNLSSGCTDPALCNPQTRLGSLVRGLTHVLRLSNAPPRVIDSMVDQLRENLGSNLSELVFVARAKAILAWPLARYLRCTLPPNPKDFVFSWKGHMRRWFYARLSHFSRRNTWLFSSFYQAKRSCAVVEEEFIHETYLKHRRQMAAPDPLVRGCVRDEIFVDHIASLLEPITRRVSREVYDDFINNVVESDGETRKVAHTPSSRACLETSRAGVGQFGRLASEFKVWLGLGPCTPFSFAFQPELLRVHFYEKVRVDDVTKTSVLVSTYHQPELEALWSLFLRERDDVDRLQVEPPSGPYTAMIQGVLEPLKVRVISKGPAHPYYMCKWFQRSLHDSLRRLPGLELIGRPLDPLLVQRVYANPSIPLSPYEDELMMMSGDYTAATDGLSAMLSDRLMSDVTRELPVREICRISAALAPHVICYPCDSGIAPVMQENGQLMGSIVSFVILCLANLGLYLAVLDAHGDSRSLQKKLEGVLVNGDDILYRAPSAYWSTHMTLGKRMGLEMSVGKAFYHRSFAQVNSQSYHCYPDGSVIAVPFLNTGLLFGQSKVLGRVDDGDSEGERSIASIVNELLDAVPDYQQKFLFEEFVSLHVTKLTAEAKGRNWFVSESLGGLGIRPPSGWCWTVNRFQHQLASRRCAMELGREVFGSRILRFGHGLPGHELDDLTGVPDASTRIVHPVETFATTLEIFVAPKAEKHKRLTRGEQIRLWLETSNVSISEAGDLWDALQSDRELELELAHAEGSHFFNTQYVPLPGPTHYRPPRNSFEKSGRCDLGDGKVPKRLKRRVLELGLSRCC